ncbi:osmotically inducible protein OsmC [Sphingobacterium puteale]|uniref:Osmotically inducible protein OsmC n=1 Tax=Sphingobacterium puteale TaxID=2420510 RepID=A0A420VTL6_9SPHI|nr:OsmC family protein [Sphingobacterium puteale]RKO69644.1 osmotically inducible protein OsmC [Sphingobacterium puteale]
MAFKHYFKATLRWFHQQKPGSGAKLYPKSHRISIQGKTDLQLSAAKAFKGDPKLYNPEDLLLSSLVSCHMMSYLYVCSKNNIEVISYTDNAEAVLETGPDGSGRFVQVDLYPEVSISDPTKIVLALSLHHEANRLCFIANSCNFPVRHHAVCSVC